MNSYNSWDNSESNKAFMFVAIFFLIASLIISNYPEASLNAWRSITGLEDKPNQIALQPYYPVYINTDGTFKEKPKAEGTQRKFASSYLTYNISGCDNAYEVKKINQAFKEIQKATNNVLIFEFNNETDSPSFSIYCHEEKRKATDSDNDLLGVGYYWHIDNTITRAAVDFYGVTKSSSVHDACSNYPDTEIHEILHGLDFDHNTNKNSIMYYLSTSCNKIDSDITETLIQLYS